MLVELGINESCCAVSCHAQRDCKLAASDRCSASPVECATGLYIFVKYISSSY